MPRCTSLDRASRGRVGGDTCGQSCAVGEGARHERGGTPGTPRQASTGGHRPAHAVHARAPRAHAGLRADHRGPLAPGGRLGAAGAGRLRPARPARGQALDACDRYPLRALPLDDRDDRLDRRPLRRGLRVARRDGPRGDRLPGDPDRRQRPGGAGGRLAAGAVRLAAGRRLGGPAGCRRVGGGLRLRRGADRPIARALARLGARGAARVPARPTRRQPPHLGRRTSAGRPARHPAGVATRARRGDDGHDRTITIRRCGRAPRELAATAAVSQAAWLGAHHPGGARRALQHPLGAARRGVHAARQLAGDHPLRAAARHPHLRRRGRLRALAAGAGPAGRPPGRLAGRAGAAGRHRAGAPAEGARPRGVARPAGARRRARLAGGRFPRPPRHPHRGGRAPHGGVGPARAAPLRARGLRAARQLVRPAPDDRPGGAGVRGAARARLHRHVSWDELPGALVPRFAHLPLARPARRQRHRRPARGPTPDPGAARGSRAPWRCCGNTGGRASPT